MKTLFAVFVLCFAAVSASFAAGKPCDELKSEIAAKIDAKNVKGYELNIVRSEDVKDDKVVGSCEGGTKKITYRRHANEATADHPAAAPASTQSAQAEKGPADAHKDSPDHN